MGQKPSWRSWLARQSHNLKVVSSSLTEGIFLIFRISLQCIFRLFEPERTDFWANLENLIFRQSVI